MDSYEIDICVEDSRWLKFDDLQSLSERAVAMTMVKCDPKPFTELSLAFVSDAHMQGLNKQYRKIDRPTNVLSFPVQNGDGFSPLLGDIVFAFETITAQAKMHNISITNHLSHLIIHGFLHLQGYDHEATQDADIMEKLEIHVLAGLGISNPYANERTL